MLPLNLLTEVPIAIAQQISPAIVPALSNLAVAAVPAASSAWRSVANSVERNWVDGTDTGGAGVSLARAANAAADLEGRAQTIDGDIARGSAAIISAVGDLARIAVDFMLAAARFLPSATSSPAGMAQAAAGIAGAATSAMNQAMERLRKLEQELSPLVQSLMQQASAAVDTPPSPKSAQLDTAATQAASTGSADPVASTAGSSEGNQADAGTAGAAPVDGNAGADAPTPEAQAAVQAALSAVGTPYGWGGNTPGQALDCSGLTHWAYGQAGVDIPRTAEAQAIGRQVSQDELLPGDLAVWDGHVAMVVGDGQMVEAGDPVQVNPVRTTNIGMPFKGFYRPTG
ncbi:MAG: NlpC/P60 family protein [Corynebacterium sp.]|uniref:C40 family peptidase n=1 Tax=Corynebacterium sp. TaxID=1720 RepID=UPI0026DCAD79|nr:C40 family peptidase [Corynebacterium sp.]MDO5030140.1 NlpC/P60 family protein [Corynebacterium sp.]